MHGTRIHRKRGKRGGSRQARERRALDAALRTAPTVGVTQERTGRFYVNHDREQFALDAHVPDDAPRDDYFLATPGAVYVEYCDKCRRPNENPHCKTCHGAHVVRREYV